MLPPPWENVLRHPFVGVKGKKNRAFSCLNREIVRCTGRTQKITYFVLEKLILSETDIQNILF